MWETWPVTFGLLLTGDKPPAACWEMARDGTDQFGTFANVFPAADCLFARILSDCLEYVNTERSGSHLVTKWSLRFSPRLARCVI